MQNLCHHKQLRRLEATSRAPQGLPHSLPISQVNHPITAVRLQDTSKTGQSEDEVVGVGERGRGGKQRKWGR